MQNLICQIRKRKGNSKMKKRKKIVIIVSIGIILIGMVKLFTLNKHKDNGNIANMGLVTQSDKTVYYNKYEKGIFAYKNGKEQRLTDETAYAISVFEDQIYYITISDFSNVVIKRIDTNGENLKKIATIYTSLSKFFVRSEGIYYLANKGIARIDRNGEGETLVFEENIQDFQIVGDEIFYTNVFNQIGKVSISGENPYILNEEANAKKMQVVDNWIYYLDENENALFRFKPNGKDKELVSILVKNQTYNVCGNYVYYLDKENSTIARMKIGKSNQCDSIVTISVTNTKINIANDELYYLDKSKDESQTYQMYRIGLKGQKTKSIEY